MGGFAKSRAETSFLSFCLGKKGIFDYLIIFLTDGDPVLFPLQTYPVHLQLPDVV